MDFGVLGSLQVRDDEGRELALGAGRQRALLAFLLLHENEVVPTELLIDELWAGHPPSTAPKIVQNHVSQLRRALGDGRLRTIGHGYLLEVEPGALDVDRFESLADEGARSLGRGDAGRAAARLRDALSLWRGAPLAEFAYEPFAQSAIARLEELRLAATEDRIDADLALGRHAEIVAELEQLVRGNPLRERPRAQLMLALYRSGRQAEALEVYREGRAALVGQLGLEPGDELQTLQHAILAHAPELSPPAVPASAGLAARGLRRPRVLAALGIALVGAAAVAAVVALVGGSERRPVVVAADSVAAIDPASGRILGQVPVGERPAAVAVDRDAVWVVNADSGTVTRIDPTTRRLVKTIGTSTGAPATDVAVGAGAVWVAGGSDGTLIRIDPQTNAVVKTIDLAGPDKLAPRGVYSVATGAGAVWVGSGAYAVLKIDPATNEVVATIPVGFTPADIDFGAGALWVATTGGRVLRIDPVSDRFTGSVAATTSARGIAVGEGGVWVTDAAYPGRRGLLWRIDPVTVSNTGQTKLPRIPSGVATGGGDVWVAGGESGSVTVVDPRSGEIVGSIHVGNAPLDVAYGGREPQLWVTVGASGAAAT